MLKVVDSHAHLNDIVDLNEAIKRAKSNGVIAIISMGTNYQSINKVLEISRRYSGFVFPAAGIHPWGIDENSESGLKFMSKRIEDFVAIGEVGLDYWIKKNAEIQKRIFKKILDLADTSKKPIVVHSRGAWEDAFEHVSSYNLDNVIFHWYSGPKNILEKIVDRGYFISATPAVKYSKPHREAIECVPPENLILETDSPVKYRGVTSEPADVLKVLNYVAELKNMRIGSLAEVTNKNIERIFHLKLDLT